MSLEFQKWSYKALFNFPYENKNPNIPMSKVHLHLFSEIVAGIQILAWAFKKKGTKDFYSMYYLLCLFIHSQESQITNKSVSKIK